MVVVDLGSETFEVAVSWQELDYNQTLFFAGSNWLENPSEEFYHEAVQKLLKCSDSFWNSLELGIEQWNALKKLCDFVFTRVDGLSFQYFIVDNSRYHIFKPDFEDMDSIDIAYANIQYLQFIGGNELALDELIATICRPTRKDIKTFKLSKDWDGDIREVFNSQRVKERAKLFEQKLDFGLKIAILQYFESENNKFLEQYAGMFGNDGKEPRYDNGMGWITMLMNVASSGTFGDFDRVGEQNCHLIWTKCLDDTLEQREQLEAQKAQK